MRREGLTENTSNSVASSTETAPKELDPAAIAERLSASEREALLTLEVPQNYSSSAIAMLDREVVGALWRRRLVGSTRHDWRATDLGRAVATAIRERAL
jgi:hypothetical protein